MRESLQKRACCAPLPREINNYYNRCHGKKPNHSDCKGSCYCKDDDCECSHKGVKEPQSNTSECACYNYPTKATHKKNPLNFIKGTCKKCKKCDKPKRQRSASPKCTKTNNTCRCCSPQRCASPQRQTNVCKYHNINCQKLPHQSSRTNENPTEKKYILCYKPYEEGDSMLEVDFDSNQECGCCEKRNNIINKCWNKRGADPQQNRTIVCTCGLMTACDCEVEGLWGKGGGKDEAAPQCRRCGQKVYAAEKLMASGGAFHTSCFSCYGCHKSLEVTNLYESQGEIYCKHCYAKYFGMSGYGYGTTLLSPV